VPTDGVLRGVRSDGSALIIVAPTPRQAPRSDATSPAINHSCTAGFTHCGARTLVVMVGWDVGIRRSQGTRWKPRQPTINHSPRLHTLSRTWRLVVVMVGWGVHAWHHGMHGAMGPRTRHPLITGLALPGFTHTPSEPGDWSWWCWWGKTWMGSGRPGPRSYGVWHCPPRQLSITSSVFTAPL